MKKRTAVKVDANDVPEVLEYLMAEEELEEFRTHHAKVFAALAPLVEKRNATLEAADKVLRAGGLSCEPFNLTHFTVKYNPEEAFNMLGRDAFLAVGGKIENKTVYDIDKDRFEAANAQGKIAEEVVTNVRTETPTYKKPKPIIL
jgi:hypothetical protein